MNAYYIIKSQGRPNSVKGTPLKKSVVASQLNTPQPLPNNNQDERKQVDELDDIAKKLEQVSHKLGRPVSGHLPVPLDSDVMNSDFPSIQLVRNDHVDPLNKLYPALQELCIIEDLLFLVLVRKRDFHILIIFKLIYRILMENTFHTMKTHLLFAM